jgi:hypothetical protein
VTGRVASCVPLGKDGEDFLVGAALYTQGNVWGIADPPADWHCAAPNDPNAANADKTEPGAAKPGSSRSWPYNMFADKTHSHNK